MSLPNVSRAHYHVTLEVSIITEDGVLGGPSPAGVLVLASTEPRATSVEGLGLYLIGVDIDTNEEMISFIQPPEEDDCDLHPSYGPCGGRMTLASDATITQVESPESDGF